jgi:hypothetical protein
MNTIFMMQTYAAVSSTLKYADINVNNSKHQNSKHSNPAEGIPIFKYLINPVNASLFGKNHACLISVWRETRKVIRIKLVVNVIEYAKAAPSTP